MESWPESAEALVAAQRRIAGLVPPPWSPGPGALLVGGCYVCFRRDRAGSHDWSWAAAAITRGHRLVAVAAERGSAGAPYEPGLLALREGAVLEAAVRALPQPAHVLIVNASGRDHPRRCGLAVHLGAVLDIPTLGVTDRPLVACGRWPDDVRGASAPLFLDGEVVGSWLRTRAGARPVAVTSGWRTDPEMALRVTMAAVRRARTPEPLRRARRAARLARSGQ